MQYPCICSTSGKDWLYYTVLYWGVYCFPVFWYSMAWYKNWCDIGWTEVENFRSKQSRLGCMLCHFMQEAKNINSSTWTHASFKRWKTYFLMNEDQRKHNYYLLLMYNFSWYMYSVALANNEKHSCVRLQARWVHMCRPDILWMPNLNKHFGRLAEFSKVIQILDAVYWILRSPLVFWQDDVNTEKVFP